MGMTSTATYLTSFPLIFVVILMGSVLVTVCDVVSCGSGQDLPKTCDRWGATLSTFNYPNYKKVGLITTLHNELRNRVSTRLPSPSHPLMCIKALSFMLVVKFGALRHRWLFIWYPTICRWSRMIQIRRDSFIFGISGRRVRSLFITCKLSIQTPPLPFRINRKSASRLQKTKGSGSIWRPPSSSTAILDVFYICWCNHGIRGWSCSQDKLKAPRRHVVATLLKDVLICQ